MTYFKNIYDFNRKRWYKYFKQLLKKLNLLTWNEKKGTDMKIGK